MFSRSSLTFFVCLADLIFTFFLQLTPQRPLRPETDRRSRPISGHFKASPLRIVPVPLTPRSMSKADSHDYDEPPPLPMKHVSLEVGNTESEIRNSTVGHKTTSYYRERVGVLQGKGRWCYRGKVGGATVER